MSFPVARRLTPALAIVAACAPAEPTRARAPSVANADTASRPSADVPSTTGACVPTGATGTGSGGNTGAGSGGTSSAGGMGTGTCVSTGAGVGTGTGVSTGAGAGVGTGVSAGAGSGVGVSTGVGAELDAGVGSGGGLAALGGPSAAPAGTVVIVVGANRCASAPCGAGTCAVACPPAADLVQLDVQEGVQGAVTVSLDGVVVIDATVRGASLTGLQAHATARPARWPAQVTVQVRPAKGAAQTASARVERSTRFVGIGGAPVRIHAQSGPFGYD